MPNLQQQKTTPVRQEQEMWTKLFEGCFQQLVESGSQRVSSAGLSKVYLMMWLIGVYIYGSCWELLPSRVYRDQNEWIHHRCEYVTHFSFEWGAAAYLDEFPIICLLPQLFTVSTGTGMLVWQGEWEVGWKYTCQFSFWTLLVLTSCNLPLLHTSCSEAWLTELL